MTSRARAVSPPVRRVAAMLLVLSSAAASAGCAGGDAGASSPVPGETSGGTSGATSRQTPGRTPAQTSGRTPGQPPGRTLRALEVLHRWDRARASAYAAGDAARLRRLYAPSSRAAAADVRLLQRYAARGLVVRGMRRQVLQARVRRWTDGRLTLRVTDRLVGAVAAGVGVRRALPETHVQRWLITFQGSGRRWSVVRVRGGQSPG